MIRHLIKNIMKLTTMLKTACVFFVIINVSSINGWLQRFCKIPNGDGGRCVLLKYCPPLLDIHTNPYRSTRELQYLLQSAGACGSQGRWHKAVEPQKFALGGTIRPASQHVVKQHVLYVLCFAWGGMVAGDDLLEANILVLVCCPPMYQWYILNINPVHYPASDIYIAAHPDLQNPDVTTTAQTIDNQPPVVDSQSDVIDTPRKIDSIPSTIEVNNKLAEKDADANTWNKNQPDGVDSQSDVIDTVKKIDSIPNTVEINNKLGDKDEDTTTRLHVNEENAELIECGVQTSGSRIVGGSVADIDEYPWLALLEYDPDQLSCGGSLITDRFVLTAAHCLTGIKKPAKVRLSEYNITTGPTDLVEREGGGFEKISVTIIPVELAIPHPNSVDNDIGLIKMKDRVQFSDFIRPICLPTRDLRSEFTAATKFIVAGWGSDNVHVDIPVKMDVLVPYVGPPDECATSPQVVQGRYICAGGEAGKDSCSGDSGGPLMLYADVFTAVGIVSHGPYYCGTKGVAAEYTYVYTYLEWINSTMEANK